MSFTCRLILAYPFMNCTGGVMLTHACESSPMTGCSVMSSLHHGYGGSPVNHMGGSHYDEYSVYSPNEVMGGYYSRKCSIFIGLTLSVI